MAHVSLLNKMGLRDCAITMFVKEKMFTLSDNVDATLCVLRHSSSPSGIYQPSRYTISRLCLDDKIEVAIPYNRSNNN